MTDDEFDAVLDEAMQDAGWLVTADGDGDLCPHCALDAHTPKRETYLPETLRRGYEQ